MCDTSFEGYQILQTLGEGSFGQVKLASKDGDLFAIKFSSQSNAYSPQILQKIFIKQTNIIAGLNHPNIIKLYGSYMSGNFVKPGICEKKKAGIIFQYAPHNLGQIMELGALQQPLARTLFRQMLDGISYLHSNNIIHRDIKPENILFDQNFNVKICDFGLSTRVDTSNKPKTICGSDSFKSPQVLMKKNYNGVMNDLFAAGVTLFILVTGHAPFITAAPHSGQYQFIALNYFDKFWKVHEQKQKYSYQFKNLINSMLAFDPTYRLSISQILCHPWMNSDTLMGDELAQQMNKKVTEIIEKKKMIMLKQMRNRVKKVANKRKQNRALKHEQKLIFQKTPYRKETARLTDRLIPKVTDFPQIEQLFEEMSGQMRYSENSLELIKIFEQNEIVDRVILRIKVEDLDEDSDCLKFNLIQGNTIRFIDILNEFDEKILAQKQ